MTTVAGRQLVAERGLTARAVSALIPLMANVGFEELGEVKALLKRFFSASPWTALDAAALRRAVGPPPIAGDDDDGDDDVRVSRRPLDDALTLVAGWVDGGFFIDVDVDVDDDLDEVDTDGDAPNAAVDLDLGRTFGYGVVPEPTPNPRTLRFATTRRPVSASESYRRGARIDDVRVAAIFAVDNDVIDVLVGSDFVAVSLTRPARWPELLTPVLAAVATAFGGDTGEAAEAVEPLPSPEVEVRAGKGGARPASASAGRDQTRLERAWADLGALHAGEGDDLDAVVAAARDTDGAHRQVAAQLLVDAPHHIATAVWSELVSDTSRGVRRAAVDAVVDADREELRPLLERALTDADAWVRWKALHGLAVLGVQPSLAAIALLDDDPDFRVRLEAANARGRQL